MSSALVELDDNMARSEYVLASFTIYDQRFNQIRGEGRAFDLRFRRGFFFMERLVEGDTVVLGFRSWGRSFLFIFVSVGEELTFYDTNA